MHCHQSLFDANGHNLFYSPDGLFNLSDLAFQFIEGQLNHARAMTAIIAPTINSYKRLVPGYEAPVYVGWAQTNRSALIRIPRYNPGKDKAVRAELRCPDPSANPYLAMAAMLAAGLDGIEKKMACRPGLTDTNVYHLTPEERRDLNITELPGSLAEALRALADDPVVQHALGNEMYHSLHHKAELLKLAFRNPLLAKTTLSAYYWNSNRSIGRLHFGCLSRYYSESRHSLSSHCIDQPIRIHTEPADFLVFVHS